MSVFVITMGISSGCNSIKGLFATPTTTLTITTSPTITPSPTNTSTPIPTSSHTPIPTSTNTMTPMPQAKINGQIEHTLDEQPKTRLVIPCLIVEEKKCQMQSNSATTVSDDGLFEITVAPGTYTLFYGPADAESTRPLWEDMYIELGSPTALAESFDPNAKSIGCRRYIVDDNPTYIDGTPMYLVTNFDTVWIETVLLQIDVPGGYQWHEGTFVTDGDNTPLQVTVIANEMINVTLVGFSGCED